MLASSAGRVAGKSNKSSALKGSHLFANPSWQCSGSVYVIDNWERKERSVVKNGAGHNCERQTGASHFLRCLDALLVNVSHVVQAVNGSDRVSGSTVEDKD